jgi:hypothetical protein
VESSKASLNSIFMEQEDSRYTRRVSGEMNCDQHKPTARRQLTLTEEALNNIAETTCANIADLEQGRACANEVSYQVS